MGILWEPGWNLGFWGSKTLFCFLLFCFPQNKQLLLESFLKERTMFGWIGQIIRRSHYLKRWGDIQSLFGLVRQDKETRMYVYGKNCRVGGHFCRARVQKSVEKSLEMGRGIGVEEPVKRSQAFGERLLWVYLVEDRRGLYPSALSGALHMRLKVFPLPVSLMAWDSRG